jgi:hypothetical protein
LAGPKSNGILRLFSPSDLLDNRSSIALAVRIGPPNLHLLRKNSLMKFNVVAMIALLTVSAVGCERKPTKDIQVDAPGVKVDIEKNKGVEVNAPGVHVDTAPADGSGVKVDVNQAK